MSTAAPATTGVTVRTTSGVVRGTVVDGVHTFLGIPYAAPPVGARRFLAPVRPDPWDGVREVVAFGPTAPQAESVSPMMPQVLVAGDDYLNLNVFTTDPGAAGLPVLFNIHGGGLVFGSNIHPTSGAPRLAQRGMVVVSINYRLGIEGFLPLHDAPPNRGVLDWLLALEWVQDNIAAFGGDPDQVTISGYSSGSAACCVLLGLPQAAGLFRGAIPMSGTAWNQVDLTTAEPGADRMAARLGVERTIAGLASVPAARLIRIQDQVAYVVEPITDPLATFREIASGPGVPGPRPGRGWLGPIVDGTIVPELTDAAIAAGAGGDRGLLIGCTANEMDVLMTLFGNAIEREEAELALATVGLDDASVARWFGALDGRTPPQVLGAALTALTFRLPALRMADAHREAGGASYLYRFEWQPSTPFGAAHCIDLPFAFDVVDLDGFDMLCGGEPPPSLVDDCAGAISRFVIDGDPGWPAYEDAARHVMAFDLPSTVQLDPDHDRAVRDAFGSLR